MIRALGVALVVVIAGCSSGSAPAPETCPAAVITVGGVVSPLAHGRGFRDDDGRLVIIVFAREVACADVLADDLPYDEERLEISTGPDFIGVEYVAYNAHGLSLSLDNRSTVVLAPAKVGDPMAVCAKGAVKATAEVVFDGRFEATYCGERR